MRARLFAAALVCLAPLLAVAGGIYSFGEGDIVLRINSSTNNYDICTAAQSLGCPTCNVGDSKVRVILANGVVVGSTSTGTLAMQTGNCGSAWGSGWTVHVVVEGTNSARIQGKGGNGGGGSTGEGSSPGGGGGGGAGTQVGAGGFGGASIAVPGEDGDPGTATAGGAGGAGDPPSQGDGLTGTAPGGTGGDGGPALRATSSGPDVELRPESGATLEVWGGGGGGGGGGRTAGVGATGGNGGNPGLSGATGAGSFGAGTGGGAGLAYSTSDATITEIGPGTIDCRGGGC